ncbi:MAG TPA: deoxyribodipyrimidine photo-lyase, partial [Methanomassiliicoccales archaeon]|nr:deoxyribodipyrimidine photo-lyase [Methanomassiliicoccales archaeon]
LGILFCLAPGYLGAGPHHYRFMMEGLKETIGAADRLGMSFFLLEGDPSVEVPRFLEEWKVSLAVIDFDPLRQKMDWRDAAMEGCDSGFEEVDAHNIVPCWAASPKQEFAAATFRPKMKRHLPDRLAHLPPSPSGSMDWPGEVSEERSKALERNDALAEGRWKGGPSQARRALDDFIRERLSGYGEKRNDPNLDWTSGLSPYLHFGMISAQRVALTVMAAEAPQTDKDAFLEELIVRRELSDNFCYYNRKYDSAEGFPAWARATLREHQGDRRDHLYTENELEHAKTHDPLWNAAQVQMTTEGKMHGWLRMYWAKKVLEWTETPAEALRIVNSLNDRYEMDGRDPNGYVGAAWSVGGVHDRAWTERRIFGKVRYMNLNGAYRKFDVDRFVSIYADRGR